MEIQPFSKELFARCKELGVDEVKLRFSGGSDEGFLDVEIAWANDEYKQDSGLYTAIENWAWDVYGYSGAGDGSDYGDDITYDFKNGKVHTSSWYTEPQYHAGEDEDLEIAD